MPEKVIKIHQEVIEKVIEKAMALNEKLTENRISIIKLIIKNPYISKSELSKHVGISENSISCNIEAIHDDFDSFLCGFNVCHSLNSPHLSFIKQKYAINIVYAFYIEIKGKIQ